MSDFVSVETWIDSESNSLHSSFIGISNVKDLQTDSAKDYVTTWED